MPREHKKRGRRDEKKRKRALQDADASNQEERQDSPEPSTKRRRPSPEAMDNERDLAPLTGGDSGGYRGVDNYGADAEQGPPGAPAPPDANEFFGILSTDDQAYFKRADSMLELDNFGSAEERSLFLASVWREASGKELKLACAQACSRILERLVRAAGARQLKRLWAQFRGHFLFLVQHRFAGHVCEALFLRAAPVVSRELMKGGVEEEPEEEWEMEVEEQGEDGEDEGAKEAEEVVNSTMESLFLEVIGELSENMGYLMTDRFASHALRVLLVVLGGKPLEDSSTMKNLRSKNKEHTDLGMAKGAEPDQSKWRTVPASFQTTLREVASKTIGSLDSHYLRALATHPVGNPVLQLLLELEFVGQGKQGTRASPNSLFRRLLPDDPPVEGTTSATFIKGLLFDPIGSRLLEVIVQHAPGKTFKAIYRSQFKENIPSTLKNEVASFVCMRMLERLGQEDLKHAVGHIAPEMPMLISRHRHAIIKILVERCRIREVDIKPIADSFLATYGEPGLNTLEKMLLTDSQPIEVDPGRAEALNHSSRKLHASLLVQTILAQPDDLRSYVNSVFVAAAGNLVPIGCDRQATHALQAALKTAGQESAAKRKLIQALLEHVADLATDPIGSHVLDSVLIGAGDSLFFQLERVAEELFKHEAQVRDTFSGRGVWRTWNMDLYQRRRDAWIKRIKEGEEGSKAAVKPGAGREKSAIELARERFAARKQKPGALNFSRKGVASRGGRGGAALTVK